VKITAFYQPVAFFFLHFLINKMARNTLTPDEDVLILRPTRAGIGSSTCVTLADHELILFLNGVI
jgi:hypothetical protein